MRLKVGDLLYKFIIWLRSPIHLEFLNGFIKVHLKNKLAFIPTLIVVSLALSAYVYRYNVNNSLVTPTPILVSLGPREQVGYDSPTPFPTYSDDYFDESSKYCVPGSNTILNTEASWKKFYNQDYSYQISYPNSWKYTENLSLERNPQTIFRRKDSIKAPYTPRLLPELYLTMEGPYSTSGAICANQICDYESYHLIVDVHGYSCTVPVTEGRVRMNGIDKFDFYAFDMTLPKLIVKDEKYGSRGAIRAVASFSTKEEGEEIARILSTLSY